jgi:hypothetical protein
MTIRSRRAFLAQVGWGMIATSVGIGMTAELGLAAPVNLDEGNDSLDFGELEPLVRLMQDTPIEQLLPVLAKELKNGTELKRLAAAAALANARTFGGEDYVGFHTMMALAPALHMSGELPADLGPLPVFKVLYRNTNRIHEHGGRASEVLKKAIPAASLSPGSDGGQALRDAVRRIDVNSAEATFAALALTSPDEAFNDVLTAVEDGVDVHRVVLPYRAWDMLGLIGKEHAHTLLRQSVRFCVKSESYIRNSSSFEPREILASTLDQHHLLGRELGDRRMDDQWVDHTATAIFEGSPKQAADLAGAALADGIEPDSLGEAICLAANQLILRDQGRTPSDEVAGKPIGSVHGDSIGVHACDSANAWRNLARAGNARNRTACLIMGAYQAARDRVDRGGDFLHWQPLPLPRHVAEITAKEPGELLNQAEAAIRGNMQAHACAAVHQYGQLGHAPRPVFDLMLKYAVSEDGSLHAEKFYRTVSEEFATTRPAFRWRHLVALARVTASEYGRPAAGYAQAKELLRV